MEVEMVIVLSCIRAMVTRMILNNRNGRLIENR